MMLNSRRCCCEPPDCLVHTHEWTDDGTGEPTGWNVLAGSVTFNGDGTITLADGTILESSSPANFWGPIYRTTCTGTLRVVHGRVNGPFETNDGELIGLYAEIGGTLKAGDIYNRATFDAGIVNEVFRTETGGGGTYAWAFTSDVIFVKSGSGNSVRLGGQSGYISLPVTYAGFSQTQPSTAFQSSTYITGQSGTAKTHFVAVGECTIGPIVSEKIECYQSQEWGAGFDESSSAANIAINFSVEVLNDIKIPKSWKQSFDVAETEIYIVDRQADVDVIEPDIVVSPMYIVPRSIAYAQKDGVFYKYTWISATPIGSATNAELQDHDNYEWQSFTDLGDGGTYEARDATLQSLTTNVSRRGFIIFDNSGYGFFPSFFTATHSQSFGGTAFGSKTAVSGAFRPDGVSVNASYQAWNTGLGFRAPTPFQPGLFTFTISGALASGTYTQTSGNFRGTLTITVT